MVVLAVILFLITILFPMKNIPVRFAIFSLLIFATSLNTFAQNTKELFSRPGLSIGAYHFNFFGGTWSTSYRYAKDTLLCGDTLLVFDLMRNTNDHVFLSIQGDKVYQQYPDNSGCPLTLVYDFGLQTGDTFSAPGGPIFTVVETGHKTLLNGETRRYLKLSANPMFPSYSIEWIEGIGDVTLGLLPFFADFEGYDQFVCARDASGDLWFDAAATDILCDSLLCATPFAAFSFTNTDDQTLSFINHSENASIWHWDFSDGTVSNEQNPQHTFTESGCYDVCLTVATTCSSQSQKQCHPVSAGSERRWKELPFPDSVGYLISVDFPTPDTGWVLNPQSIWKTNDGGHSWQQQTLPPVVPGVTRSLLRIRMFDTQLGIICGGNYGSSDLKTNILVTHDGGATWQEHNQGSTKWLHDAMLNSNGEGYAVGGYTQMLYTGDFGENWSEIPLPVLVLLDDILYWSGDTLYGFGHKGLGPDFEPALSKTFDGGLTWEVVVLTGHPVMYRRSLFLDAKEGWLPGGVGYLFHTTDGGTTWNTNNFNETRSTSAVDFANKENGWAVGTQGLILHTTDGGSNWIRENCGYEEAFLSVSAPADNVAYTVTNKGKVLKYCGSNCTTTATEAPPDTGDLIRLLTRPNPATTYIEIRLGDEEAFRDGDKILVSNSLGQQITTFKYTGATVSLDVSFLPSGWYCLQLLRNGATLARGVFVVVP